MLELRRTGVITKRMTMKRPYIIITMALFAAMKVYSQSVFGGQDMYDVLFHQSVKSCDEFMCRFNEEEFFPGLDETDPQRGKKNFLSLFDYELSQSTDKEVFLKEVFYFYDIVKSSNAKLKYESKNWFAEQRVSFIFKKKEIELSIILQVENTPQELPCWTIVGVKGLEKLGYADSLQRMVISPEQHEAEFMELESDFNFYSKHFSQFRSYHSELDPLSYFFALVETGMLTFNKRISTTFHFYNIPSFVFTVNYFNRKKSNTGWLISDYKKANQEEKNTLLKQLLGK